jgi:hypothetical protein
LSEYVTTAGYEIEIKALEARIAALEPKKKINLKKKPKQDGK